MFVAKNQIYVFIACIAFGGVFGVFLSASSVIKYFIKNRVVKIIPDVITFALIGATFSGYAYLLKLPNLRAYMLIGVFIGMLLYFKSFHILLAKCAQKLYNVCIEKLKKIKRLKNVRADKRKNSTHGGKDKTINSGRHGRRSIPTRNAFNGDDLSVNTYNR